jgi:hypothetical protein
LALFQRWLFWPLFWLIMGFALGGSFVTATTKPIYQITNPSKEQTATNKSSEREPDETTWHWLTHEAVGFFTLWLVIIAGGQLALFFWQLVLIRKSLDDAKIAAEAAKESADATAKIASSDRAWLCIEEIPSGEMTDLALAVAFEKAGETAHAGERAHQRAAADAFGTARRHEGAHVRRRERGKFLERRRAAEVLGEESEELQHVAPVRLERLRRKTAFVAEVPQPAFDVAIALAADVLISP